MKVSIYAADYLFQGACGFSIETVVDVEDMDEAEALAEDLSWKVITENPAIYENFEDDETPNIEDDILYYIFEIDKDRIGNLTNDELTDLMARDWRSFEKNYRC